MSTLRQLLEATSYRLLCVIARQRGVAVPHNCTKAGLLDLLEEALADPDRRQAALDTLSPAEQNVLEDLRLAGGRLPGYHIARRHGDFHPYRPWQPDAPSRPWEHPSSPAERPYFLGLLFWDRKTRDLVIPHDLLDFYPQPIPGPATEAPPAPAELPAAPAALHDVAQLLALLERTDVRPLHGLWLPLRLLREWGTRCAAAPAHRQARSELQTGRRRFLHYLAQTAGLVALAGPFLKPTPAAWMWLDAAPYAQWQSLWQGLDAPSPELWARCRLPGHTLLPPRVLVAALLRTLRQDAADDPGIRSLGRPRDVAARLLARDPEPRNHLDPALFEPETRLGEAVAALLAGPLVWLGAAVIAGRDENLWLTPWGAHHLEPQAHPPPKVSPPPPFTLEAGLIFTPPGARLDPLVLATLESCAERLENGAYQITQVSWIRALHRGHRLPALLERLSRAAQRPLTGAEVAALTAWAKATDRMSIRRLTVLEVADPAVLARLSGTRRGRRHIQRTLSRRAVVVDEGRLPLLARRLTQQEDVPPRVEVAPEAAPADPALGHGGAAHLWMTAQVYRALGDFIRLPVRLPSGLLEHLAALAEPGRLAAAEAAAGRTLSALRDVLDGRAVFPIWTETTLPVEESLALVEEALAEGQALEMDYYTAGRDALTHRVVEPHRVEHRGDVAYLVGFCHRAQAERTFRVSRIRTLQLVSLPPEPAVDWDL